VTATSTDTQCGARTQATIESVDQFVAHRIYSGEVNGESVRANLARIKSSGELLRALASSDQAAVYAAVNTIVYTPHWHIVRLRVLQKGRVLADVGGPDILAPISGTLRLKGRTVGSFVMSVQDDLGYLKLVTRFIGIPIDLYRAGSFVMGTLNPPPAAAALRNGESVTVAQRSYRALVLDATAFPTGPLEAALFVPAPSSALAAQSCASVRRTAWGKVAVDIAARFTPLSAHYSDLRYTLQGASGGVVFVRAGSRRLVGAGPARVPSKGTISYRGRTWAIFSWEPVPPARIYFLTPTA
jgi:hypothetical protein